jgi:ribosomal protein L29
MADIKTQSVETLRKDLIEKREALRTQRFGGAGSRSRNVRGARTLRTEIARILTEIRAQDLAINVKNK